MSFQLFGMFNSLKSPLAVDKKTSKPKREKPSEEQVRAEKIKKGFAEAKGLRAMEEMLADNHVLRDYFEERERLSEQKGATLVGALMYMNIGSGCFEADLLDALQSAHIPEAWKPEPVAAMSQYLSTIADIARKPGSRFKEFGASPELKGFYAKRIKMSIQDSVPVVHQVFVKTSLQVEEVQGENLQGEEIERYISIALKQDFQQEAGKPPRYENFELITFFDEDKWSEEDMEIFKPFVEAVKQDWYARCHGEYNADDVRKILWDMVANKMKLSTLTRGLYFVLPKHIGFVREIQKAAAKADPRIKISMIPLESFEGDKDNQEYISSVEDELFLGISKETDALLEQVQALAGGESKTQDRTWGARYADVDDIRLKIEQLKAASFFKVDVLNKSLDRIEEIIKGETGDSGVTMENIDCPFG